MATNKQSNGRNFHNFAFAINQSVSDEFTLQPGDRYRKIGFVPLTNWVAADIIIEVQIGSNVTDWFRLENNAGVIAVTTPTVDQLNIAPDDMATALDLHISKMRLVSVSTGTTTPVLQTTATTVQAYFA